MDINNIFLNNQKWIESKLGQDSFFFKRLSEGQSPQILYIGCSDSRVPAEEIMGLQSGDMFVHRNIANMVSGSDLSIMSGIEYAVNFLEVSHIIVCGHYCCGGVKAAMQSTDLGSLNLGSLNLWVRNIKDIYQLHKNELDAISNQEEKYRRLVEINVQEQCINVIKTAPVQKAYTKRKISVYGWVFDISTGKLIDLKIDFDKIFKQTKTVYHLD